MVGAQQTAIRHARGTAVGGWRPSGDLRRKCVREVRLLLVQSRSVVALSSILTPMSAEARKTTGRGYGIACSVLVLVLLGSAYGAARAGLDFRVQAAIVIGLLLVLAVLSYFGVRAGRAAPFVVTAILLRTPSVRFWHSEVHSVSPRLWRTSSGTTRT